MNKSLFKKGFSLIEILVVLSIIGILSGALYLNFNAAQIDSKNKAFRVEMKEMQLAIELYKSQKGQYPAAQIGPPCGGVSPFTKYAQSTTCGLKDYIIGLTSGFVPKLLSHTKSANSACNIKYEVSNDFSSFKLTAINCYEGATSVVTGVGPDDVLARCPSSPVCPALGNCVSTESTYYSSFAVYSPGGQCW